MGNKSSNRVYMKDMPKIKDMASFVEDDSGKDCQTRASAVDKLISCFKDIYENKYKSKYNNDPEIGLRICSTINQAYFASCLDVEEETKQAMEAAIHNFCSLHSRAGKNGCRRIVVIRF